MSLAWIRHNYGVPAWRGGRVRFQGQPGQITSSRSQYLILHLDADPPRRRVLVHPTWEIEYL